MYLIGCLIELTSHSSLTQWATSTHSLNSMWEANEAEGNKKPIKVKIHTIIFLIEEKKILFNLTNKTQD